MACRALVFSKTVGVNGYPSLIRRAARPVPRQLWGCLTTTANEHRCLQGHEARLAPRRGRCQVNEDQEALIPQVIAAEAHEPPASLGFAREQRHADRPTGRACGHTNWAGWRVGCATTATAKRTTVECAAVRSDLLHCYYLPDCDFNQGFGRSACERERRIAGVEDRSEQFEHSSTVD